MHIEETFVRVHLSVAELLDVVVVVISSEGLQHWQKVHGMQSEHAGPAHMHPLTYVCHFTYRHPQPMHIL